MKNLDMIHTAIEEGNVEVLKFALSHGVDVDTIDLSGRTPLIRAVEMGNLEMSKILIDSGANVNSTQQNKLNSWGSNNTSSVLHKAVEKGNIELVKLLIEHKADVNIKSGSWGGITPLDVAFNSKPPNFNIITLLISHGGLISSIDKNGRKNLGEYILQHGNELTFSRLVRMASEYINEVKYEMTIDASEDEERIIATSLLSLIKHIHIVNKEPTKFTSKK